MAQQVIQNAISNLQYSSQLRQFRQGPPDEEENGAARTQGAQGWRFPQNLSTTWRWLNHCVKLTDDTFPRLPLLAGFPYKMAVLIYKAIVRVSDGERSLMPILCHNGTLGMIKQVGIVATNPITTTRPDMSYRSIFVAECNRAFKVAQAFMSLQEVILFAKDQDSRPTIPNAIWGAHRNYVPDLASMRNGGLNENEAMNLIAEVKGISKRNKDAKDTTAQTLLALSLNRHEVLWRLDSIEITDQ